MATRTIVELVSDLSGDEATETLWFSFQGTDYEIDVTDKEAERLRKALSPFLAVARKRTGRKAGRAALRAVNGPSAADVRAWAVENGYDVPARGRIPAEVREAYSASA